MHSYKKNNTINRKDKSRRVAQHDTINNKVDAGSNHGESTEVFSLDNYLKSWSFGGPGDENSKLSSKKPFVKGFTKAKLYHSPGKSNNKTSKTAISREMVPLTSILKKSKGFTENSHQLKTSTDPEDTLPNTASKSEISDSSKSVRFARLSSSPKKKLVITRTPLKAINQNVIPINLNESSSPTSIPLDKFSLDLKSPDYSSKPVPYEFSSSSIVVDNRQNEDFNNDINTNTPKNSNKEQIVVEEDKNLFAAEASRELLDQPIKEASSNDSILISEQHETMENKIAPISWHHESPIKKVVSKNETPIKKVVSRNGNRPKNKTRNKKTIKNDEANLLQLLEICGQKDYYSFEEFLGSECLGMAKKIGEATFSEVFEVTTSQFTSNKTRCVLKIIPFGQGKKVLVNGEVQCEVLDVMQEVKITMELGGHAKLHPEIRTGFLKVYRVGICRGTYPISLIEAWDRWGNQHRSENNRPDYFNQNQIYTIFVIEHGGVDLEHVKLKTWRQAWSILAQIGWTLALAEESLKFEHRDLHWGNITIKATNLKHVTFYDPSKGKVYEIPCFGIRACIIDYTLSRMDIDENTIHVDIRDEGYFTGEGDYQYEIYRMMREETKGNWQSFCPKTNVFWLHYLADKILNSLELEKPQKNAKPEIMSQMPYYNAIQSLCQRALKEGSGGYKSSKELMEQDAFWKI
ncbi:10789_t:CDS:2 [Ambispora gerdemannii]|uniref:non-specific serine/threonine protein kinase n=1 Tax=Ambispora gerdemannii TaxID=144530 RepID=A0A9N9FU64_9GLOM|nr:10789_t:CDS:2 [Ambispora gerdemannii]